MNLRFAFIVLVLAFIALLLAIGVLTAIRWIRIHHPERANAILAGAAAVVGERRRGAADGVHDDCRDERSADVPAA